MRFADEFGFYELNPFPGNNQIVVSNHAFIHKTYRGQGHGKEQHLQRLRKARELGYNYILCTVNKENEAELHILEKYGWTMLEITYNSETEHDVTLWGRFLYSIPNE